MSDITLNPADLESQRDALEAILDLSSVRHILTVLSGLCHDKAQHIRENWQDCLTARQWEQAADKLDKCERQIPPV